MHLHLQRLVTELQENVWYALCIACLAILSIGLLVYEFSPWADPAIIPYTQRVDIVIAWIFLSDFFLGLVLNRHLTKKEYFKQNWLNLISSMPVSEEAVRMLRILRIYRAYRVIRAATNFYFASSRVVRNTHHESV